MVFKSPPLDSSKVYSCALHSTILRNNYLITEQFSGNTSVRSSAEIRLEDVAMVNEDRIVVWATAIVITTCICCVLAVPLLLR